MTLRTETRTAAHSHALTILQWFDAAKADEDLVECKTIMCENIGVPIEEYAAMDNQSLLWFAILLMEQHAQDIHEDQAEHVRRVLEKFPRPDGKQS